MVQQNFKNHTKIVPLFHFFALPVLVLNFVSACVRLWKLHFSVEGFIGVGSLRGLWRLCSVRDCLRWRCKTA